MREMKRKRRTAAAHDSLIAARVYLNSGARPDRNPSRPFNWRPQRITAYDVRVTLADAKISAVAFSFLSFAFKFTAPVMSALVRHPRRISMLCIFPNPQR
jgi:hypothetical protein